MLIKDKMKKKIIDKRQVFRKTYIKSNCTRLEYLAIIIIDRIILV